MPTTRLPIPNDNAGNYFDGVTSQLWIFPTILTDVAPSVTSAAISIAAAAAGAISLTAAAPITVALKKGHRLLSDNGLKVFELSADVAAGATVLPIVPFVGTIAAATVFTTVGLISVYSVAEVGAKPSTDTTSIRNYGAATNEITRTHKSKIELTPKGFVTKGDIGLSLLKRAAHGEGFVYVRYVMPDEQAIEGYFNVTGADEGSSVDKDYENSFTLSAASKITYSNLILR